MSWNPKTWKARLSSNYKNFDEWAHASDIYGLAERLGYASDEDAWRDDPWVQGSVNPRDYSLVEWPDQYLHILECKSGDVWYRPLRKNASLDLTTQIRKWVREEFCGELFLEPPIQPKLNGDYYGQILLEGRPPDRAACWDGAGFWLTDERPGVTHWNYDPATKKYGTWRK